MTRIERGAGGAGKQRGVEHEVGLVDQRHPRAVRRQQSLQRAGGVEPAEAATRDHDPPSHLSEASPDMRSRPMTRGGQPANMVRAVSCASSLYADALAPFLAEVERLRPADAEVFDAHTHLGLDEDGRSLSLPQLLSQLDDAGARRACVFPLHDPERAPAYRVPNDRVLAWAQRKRGAAAPLLPPGPGRRSPGGGRALPRGRRARHQAAPPRPGLRVRQSRDGGHLRAGRSGRGCRS